MIHVILTKWKQLQNNVVSIFEEFSQKNYHIHKMWEIAAIISQKEVKKM